MKPYRGIILKVVACLLLAFLSLIQILLVAAIGTALSGLTAVIAGLVGKKAA